MFVKSLVLFEGSVSAKFVNGEGLAVNENDVSSAGEASLMTMMRAGWMTAAAWICTSPVLHVSDAVAQDTWYGEPLIVLAEFPLPQLRRLAMCPAKARIGLATVAVKRIVTYVSYDPVPVYVLS